MISTMYLSFQYIFLFTFCETTLLNNDDGIQWNTTSITKEMYGDLDENNHNYITYTINFLFKWK